jgi:hypothetical protein
MSGLALVPLLLLASTAPVSDGRTAYCSPTGDYCTAVTLQRGDAILKLGSFYPFGHYRLCVRPPRGARACKRFRMSKRGDLSYSNVRWSRHFPDRGFGLYRIRWRYQGRPLGPSLAFRRIGPSIKADPNPMHRGDLVRVYGNTGGCRSGLTLLSGAFSHAQEFAGVPAIYAAVDSNGRYSVVTRIPSTRRPRVYSIGARCGGGNMGVTARLRVLR